MKNLILMIVVLLICFFLPEVKAQVFQYPETYLDQRECHICGKTIQERKEVEHRTFYDNVDMGTSRPGWGYIPDSLRIQYLTIKKEILVCKDCLSKYGTGIEKQINKVWSNLIVKYIKENKAKREFYKEQRRLSGIDELNKKIDELKQKREEMQGKK
jgi:hypothetical protein